MIQRVQLFLEDQEALQAFFNLARGPRATLQPYEPETLVLLAHEHYQRVLRSAAGDRLKMAELIRVASILISLLPCCRRYLHTGHPLFAYFTPLCYPTSDDTFQCNRNWLEVVL